MRIMWAALTVSASLCCCSFDKLCFSQTAVNRCSSLSLSPVVAVAPTAQPEDDGGFSLTWVNQQQHQLGPMQSTDDSRRVIQEMPSERPPPVEDDEEREYLQCSSGSVLHSIEQHLSRPPCLWSPCHMITSHGVRSRYMRQWGPDSFTQTTWGCSSVEWATVVN